MKDIKKYIAPLSAEMMENDKPSKDLLGDIDKMVEFDYTLPSKLTEKKAMRNIVTTVPYTVVTVGKRTLATIRPQVFIQPFNSKGATKKKANTIEKNLLWQLKQADKRSSRSIVSELVESALKHDAIATFTVPVSWQLKGTGKEDDADGFMIMVEDYKNIYPRFSPLGLESVLQSKVMRAKEALAFWGDNLSKELQKEINDSEIELYLTAFEWWGKDQRATWLSEVTDSPKQALATNVKYIIHDDEPELPFNPWGIHDGGQPLLAPLVQTKSFELMNVCKSIAFSEAVAYSIAPRGIKKSYAPDSITLDYGGAFGSTLEMQPTDSYEKLDPPKIDQNLLEVLDRLSSEVNLYTGIMSLANLDVPSGTAFATVNAQIKAATSSLDPAKKLAESALGKIFENVLRWAHHTKEPLIGYGFEDENMGTVYKLDPKHIDPKHLCVESKLTTHIPTDRLQRINAAVLLNKELSFSKEDAYKEIDIANPEEVIERHAQEELDEVMRMNKIKEINAATDLKIQEQQMMLQIKAEQAQMQNQVQMQQQMQQQAVEEERQSSARMANEGNPQGARREPQSRSAKGSGFNPAGGGVSPNEADPEGFLRERISNQDKGGGELAT